MHLWNTQAYYYPHLTDKELMISHLRPDFYPKVMNSIPDNVTNYLGEIQGWWFSIINMGHYGNPHKNQHKAEIYVHLSSQKSSGN